MNYNQKLAIAKIAFRQIIDVVESFEGNDLGIYFYWPKQIEVDGQMFYAHQLEKRNESIEPE